jgi:hypothetical protein
MAHPEVARHRDRMGRLVKSAVECPAADPHGERSQVGCRFGGERRDEAPIDAARQKHPDRHIGDDQAPHRLARQLAQLLDRGIEVDRPTGDARAPIAFATDPSIREGQDLPDSSFSMPLQPEALPGRYSNSNKP